MKKKKITLSNVQVNHTLGEYQRYFSHLLAKGKLHRYKLNEKRKLNPKRQYWKITDEKGEAYFYELPRYMKPNYSKSAYSMKRVMHRRPARAVLAIFVGTAVLSFTSSMVLKKVLKSPHIDPVPVDYAKLQKYLQDFIKWKEKYPKGDATKEFEPAKLSMISIAGALYDSNSPVTNNEGENIYNRRSLLCVGYGYTLTHIVGVHVDVSNASIYHPPVSPAVTGTAMEESISYCNMSIPFVEIPKVGRRDFYNINGDDEINSNKGKARSSTEITWQSDFDKHFDNKEAYEERVGKIPDSPFLYSVDEDTVLDDSTASKTSSGYEIKIKLDKNKGVARYKKRMYYLSGKTADPFYYVNLTFTTDSNLRLTKMSVEENYDVDGYLNTTGKLTTKFYYDDIPDIPDLDDSFDYSKYPA